MKTTFRFKAKIWLYPGMAGWHFVALPKQLSKEIKKTFSGIRHGWGSLPVNVTIGASHWQTSIFPDSKSDAYLLPLKAAVRKQEGVAAEDMVVCTIKIRV